MERQTFYRMLFRTLAQKFTLIMITEDKLMSAMSWQLHAENCSHKYYVKSQPNQFTDKNTGVCTDSFSP